MTVAMMRPGRVIDDLVRPARATRVLDGLRTLYLGASNPSVSLSYAARCRRRSFSLMVLPLGRS